MISIAFYESYLSIYPWPPPIHPPLEFVCMKINLFIVNLHKAFFILTKLYKKNLSKASRLDKWKTKN
jgi:hypothetical protein